MTFFDTRNKSTSTDEFRGERVMRYDAAPPAPEYY